MKALDAAKEAVREKCIGVCFTWPISAENMNRVAEWRGDWSSRVRGVCRAELPQAIRALDLSKLSADKEEK